MIEERLRLGMVGRHPEYLDEELLEQLEMRLAPEGFVEGKERPGGSQAVAGHLQLCHRVNILHLGKQFSFNPTK